MSRAAAGAALPGLLAVAAGLYGLCTGVELGLCEGTAPNAGFFPVIVGGLLAAAGLHIAVADARAATGRPHEPVRRMVLAQRRYLLGKPFYVLWSGYLLAASVAAAIVWLVASLYNFHIAEVLPATIRAVMSVVLFPAVAWLLARCQVLLPMPRGMAMQRA